MLNLSDKELDRLSREAANEHDPGDQLGPGTWDKLEWRLDNELGRVSPNPVRGARGFRRFPLYYAPAMLLLVGVSYYIIKGGRNNARSASSGSPPLTAIKSATPVPATNQPSSQDQNKAYNSTSTPEKDHGPNIAPTPPSGTINFPENSHALPPDGTPSVKSASPAGSNTSPAASGHARNNPLTLNPAPSPERSGYTTRRSGNIS